ncbi:CHAT domain-containing protein [Kordia jejudonensis]|uniref:CHAT domain-containing protein n=1 Tax=Kordia jejudonensis TaxID=1348245 RepID=UPI0006291990|nr:CHAT domain-containing protein [Kordia jejudonensis]
MKKIIRCIIILFITFSHALLYAQETVHSFLNQTETIYNAGNYQKSLELSEKAIDTLTDATIHSDSLAVARLYFYKGASEYYLQRFVASINSYNAGIQLCPNTDKGTNYKAELLYERAFSQYELGDYLYAHESSKEAALLMNTVKNPNYDYLLSIYADVAASAAALGFQKEANNYLTKAKKVYTEHKNEMVVTAEEASKPILFAYKAIEIIQSKTVINTYDITLIQQQIQHLETIQRQRKFNAAEQRMYAVSLNFLGDAYLRNKQSTTADYNKALSALDKALKVVPKDFLANHKPQFQFNKVKAYKLQKKYNKALRLLNSVLKQLSKNDTRLSYFEAEKANILLALNNKTEALEALQKSIGYIHKDTIALKNDFSNFTPSFDINETGLLVEMATTIVQRYPKDSTVLAFAANMYKLGLNQFENCYREETFNTKLTNYYETAIGGILKLKKLGYGYQDFNLEKLLNTMEVIENRLVWKQFQQSRLLNTLTISDDLLEKERLIRRQLVLARKQKDKAAIFENTSQLASLLETLQSEFPYISAFAFENFDIQTIQAQLSDTKAIVKYKRIENQFYAFYITKTAIDFYEVENNDESLVPSIENFYSQLSNQHEDKVLARVLHQKLLPMNDDAITEYTIIPDDVLHYIPFETLVTPNVKYLIEDVSIHYATHLVFVHDNVDARTNVKNENILVFTPTYTDKIASTDEIAFRDQNFRLLGAEKESELLSTIFPSTLFESILATKDNFIKYSPKAKIIHLAMHANIDNETPELSHLLFNEKNQDSKLYIEELYGLHLHADLAVLSACNTGKGSLDASQGMVSLNRAFTMAGVPSTLASLWEVPDKVTQGIMVDFYQNLKKGESKTMALRNAKIKYLKDTDDANFQMPFYWAGFVLHGDITPILLEKDSPNNFICIIAFILLLIIGFIVRSRLKTNTLKLF